MEAEWATIFTGGWRPFIGWTCGVALAYHWILQPMAAFILANAGYEVVLPVFDRESLYALALVVLGLETVRGRQLIESTIKAAVALGRGSDKTTP